MPVIPLARAVFKQGRNMFRVLFYKNNNVQQCDWTESSEVTNFRTRSLSGNQVHQAADSSKRC